MVQAPSHVIAVDLGGTHIRAALVARDGVVTARIKVPSAAQEGPETVVAQIVALARQVGEGAAIGGLGICAPGPLDAEAGVALASPTIRGFVDFPLRAAIAAQVDWPVTLENDAMAATLGEWRAGAAQGLRDFVYLTVSTGIGGGAVCDGRLLRGQRGMAAHFGHLPLSADGPLCACGARGCFEAWASGAAFSARAREAGLTDAAKACAAARAGDAAALALVHDEGRLLGRGITGLVHAFSPQAVILGGGLSQEFALLAPHVRAEIDARAMVPYRGVRLLPAELGDDAGLRGIAALVFDRSPPAQESVP